jgi:GNAT superfamily N-acetyltransferase
LSSGLLGSADPGDADALLAFFSSLSNESLFLRFHGIRRVDSSLVEPLLGPDWIEHGALVGWLAGGDDRARIVAVASYARLARDTAEMAFAVADDEQGRGIGTRLLNS